MQALEVPEQLARARACSGVVLFTLRFRSDLNLNLHLHDDVQWWRLRLTARTSRLALQATFHSRAFIDDHAKKRVVELVLSSWRAHPRPYGAPFAQLQVAVRGARSSSPTPSRARNAIDVV